ncbi:MAG TPA: hypothetical protein DCS93_31660 [Microscillaceae bacterium]|nr:hypothetical protein [Microscillaceae bacterium]
MFDNDYNLFLLNLLPNSFSPSCLCFWSNQSVNLFAQPNKRVELKLAISLPERYMNRQRVELFFYMAFLILTLVVMPLSIVLQKRVKNKNNIVSILKLCSFIRSNMEVLISGKKCSHILKVAERYCLYEHRKKRINAIERIFFYKP